MSRVVILGCGYVGLHLARRLVEEGHEVLGTTRDPGRFAEIRDAGAEPHRADVNDPESLETLLADGVDVIYDLVRPQRDALGEYTDAGTRNVIAAALGRPLEAVIYVGSTSVYGRRGGEWTDEETPVDPRSPVAEARVQAEERYREAFREQALPVRICRVPGIYGPGRTLRSRLETGAYRRLEDEKLWVSRIHVTDLAEALVAAWHRGRAGETYLLCDDEPVPGDRYAEMTAEMLGLPMPPTVERDDIRKELSENAFERRVSSRRCSNRKMREELGVRLRYPTVHEGLPHALELEQD